MTQPTLYRPSNMVATVNCHGRRNIIDGILSVESAESREGTAAHYVCEWMLTDVYAEGLIGTPAPNGYIIDEDMVDAARLYVDSINAVTHTPFIEQSMAIPSIHPECTGTPDAWWFDISTYTLHIWDYKYGHSYVEVFQNLQLIAYFSGILDSLNIPNLEMQLTVSFNIVQPRCFNGSSPVRNWTVPATELRGFVNLMRDACAMNDRRDQPVTSGSHCKHCIGRHRCDAALESATASLSYSKQPAPRNPTNVGLAYEALMIEEALSILKSRKEAIDAEITARLSRNNGNVPGWGLQQSYSRDKWLVSDEDVINLGDIYGVDFRKPEQPKTPSQIKSKLKKFNIDEAVIINYHGREANGLKLVRDDGSKAKRIFSEGKLTCQKQ